MKNAVKQNLSFLIPYLVFLLVAGVFLLIYSKREAHLILNQCNNESCDVLFSRITYLGDGITVILVILSLCFIKYRYAVFVTLCNLLSSAITHTLKNTLFSDVDRPVKYFEGVAKLHLIPWIQNYMHHSFPSGHTTAAFATFFSLTLISKDNRIKLLLFFVAFSVGISRVYLSQHFLNDVYAGSLIGVVSTLILYKYFYVRTEHVLWMEKSILKNR